MSRAALVALAAAVAGGAAGCSTDQELGARIDELTASQKQPRYAKIRDAARAHGVSSTGFLFAGIANDETGLAMCWSEATWACKGPGTPECGGGPIIAGAADGPCSAQQGGLGMFQFDAGTFTDTLNTYGNDVLTVDGQIRHAVSIVVRIVKLSAYTTNAETDAKALAWINNFDIHDGVLRDQWIKTLVRYYNGCADPSWSCWGPRYQTYSDGLQLALDETGGTGYWAGGTRCGNSPTVIGAIEAKYLALGGCGSVLGAPITDERAAPDHVGRYSVFQHGSIYWTPQLGAHEVHGAIRDRWSAVGWETGRLGYPISDEVKTPDGVGRYTVFQRGSIYWSPATGAYEVLGRIRDAWAAHGWETGSLGYPISGEYDVAGGRRSDFQHGAITWNAAADTTQVTAAP